MIQKQTHHPLTSPGGPPHRVLRVLSVAAPATIKDLWKECWRSSEAFHSRDVRSALARLRKGGLAMKIEDHLWVPTDLGRRALPSLGWLDVAYKKTGMGGSAAPWAIALLDVFQSNEGRLTTKDLEREGVLPKRLESAIKNQLIVPYRNGAALSERGKAIYQRVMTLRALEAA